MVATRIISECGQHINISTSLGSVDCTDDLPDQTLKEKKMNRLESITKPGITKPMIWLTALLLAAMVAGCGGTHDGVLSTSTGGSADPVLGSTCTGASCVNLGKAGNFAILSKAGITDVPASPITGNIGTSGITGASITVPCTDMLNGKVYTDDANYPGFTCTSTDKTMASLAVLDMGTAYTNAGLMATTGTPACPGSSGAMNDTNDGGALAPGVYKCAIDVSIPSGILTLNGSATDVWVFNITGKLTQISGTQVKLTGGALPQNVFWVVSDVVTIGTTAHMEGVILAQTNIAVQTGATVKGRLLAQTDVSLDTSTITKP